MKKIIDSIDFGIRICIVILFTIIFFFAKALASVVLTEKRFAMTFGEEDEY